MPRPVAAVLLAGVQVIGVNREPATGAMLPGVWRKARRFQAKLLTEPRLVFDPPKPGLLPGQVHGPSEHAGSGRVRLFRHVLQRPSCISHIPCLAHSLCSKRHWIILGAPAVRRLLLPSLTRRALSTRRALLLLAHRVAFRYCRLSSLMKLPMQRAFRRQSIHPAIG